MRGILYTHLSRTGGDYIASIFGQIMEVKKIEDQIPPRSNFEGVIFGQFKHNGIFDSHLIQLTMLRHPVDRVVSLYHHLVEAGDCEEFNQDWGITDFVESRFIADVENGMTRQLSPEPEIKIGKQKPSRSMRIIDAHRAYFNLIRFDSFGIYERLDQSLDLFEQKLGKSLSRKSHEATRKKLSPEQRRAIETVNFADLALYNMAVGHFETHAASR